MRPALPLLLLFAAAAGAQLPSDGRSSYTRDNRISLPFELRTSDKATRVALHVSYADGPWQEADSIRTGGKKGFVYVCDREGPYAFATVTHFEDGRTDPARTDNLQAQKRVVYDRTAPRVHSVRAVTSPEGDPGIEWDLADDNLHPKGVKLEFRWDGLGRFDPIDRNAPLSARGARHWKLKARERMQVRVVASDWAGNKAESDPVWVAGKDADRWGGDEPAARPAATGTSGVRDTAVTPAGGPAQANLHYVNDKDRRITLNVDAKVGPSGLKKAYLWWANEKLEWQKWKEDVGPLPAPPATTPDAPRKVPVTFTFTAPNDGLYSFIVVVENHRQANRRDPRKGDTGELQVMVDTQKPTVQLISTRVSPNGDRGALVDIRYKAQDTNIAPLPIKLEYLPLKDRAVDDPTGWKALSQDWIDNTGQFTWTVPTGEAHLFKIRATCRDRAGNDSSHESETINVDLSVPGVEAVDVVPGASGLKLGGPPGKGKLPGQD